MTGTVLQSGEKHVERKAEANDEKRKILQVVPLEEDVGGGGGDVGEQPRGHQCSAVVAGLTVSTILI